MRHLVQKQEFIITARKFEIARQWESRAGDILNRVINPAMEKCFDKISSDNSFRIIDRVEIDLGIVHAGTSEEELKNIVTQQLMKTLQEYSFLKDNDPAGIKHGDIFSPGFKKGTLSYSEARCECLIHFLVYGRLPWWAEDQYFSFTKEWMEEISPQQVSYISGTLNRWIHARKRLVHQFGLDFVVSFLRRQIPETIYSIHAAWKWIENISKTLDRNFLSLRNEFWLYWTGKSTNVNESILPLQLALKKWISANPHLQAAFVNLFENKRKSSISDSTRDAVLKVLNEIARPAFDTQVFLTRNSGIQNPKQDNGQNKIGPTISDPSSLVGKEEINAKAIREFLQVNPTDDLVNKENRLKKADTELNKPPGKELETQGIFAEDAGLVLLHPFLPELFRILHLLDKDQQWVSPEAQQTGVLLLTWLAHGNTNFPEYNMIIPKLFCGMPWEEVMDTTIELNDEQIRSSTELLEAVIAHWKAIGKTSLDGLREGFINREGKLSSREDGWLLTVEKKTQDILLTRLPWGLSMIRFPWQKKSIIHVDWT